MAFRKKPALRPLPDSDKVAEFANAAPVGTATLPASETPETPESAQATQFPWECHDRASKDWRSTSLRLNNHDLARLHWIAERYNRSAQWVLREFVRSCMDTEIEWMLADQKAELEALLEHAPTGARKILERLLRPPLGGAS